jgi:hypothetical protein
MGIILLASTKVVYIPFLVTERSVIVYIKTSAPIGATEEDEEMIVRHIITQFHRSGVSIVEPMEDGLLDAVPHPRRSIVGTVHDIIFKIKRGEI